ncbi:MAG TPA: phospholipid carrier-dependent glycosyltransferase [Pyrinomonadaceae bacterium]|nr:phospholipid carrier-dependent glycosyltransferase [Pyrinomonadaceae bacterium]
MDKLLIILCFLLGLVMSLAAFPDGAVTVIFISICSAVVVYIINRVFKEEAKLVTQIFLAALLARLTFGLLIHLFDLRAFFGGDAITYDALGNRLMELWLGREFTNSNNITSYAMNMSSGWGMNYLTGFIYVFTGRNIYAAQSFCGLIGAATAPMVYACAYKIFHNKRVSILSALFVALYPAFIIWSGQLLKDGLIIFLLVLSITMVLQLQEKFSYWTVGILIFALFGIISVRFYIFYMVAIAVVGSFIIGSSTSNNSIVRRSVILVIMGLSLTYLGVLRNAGDQFEEYGNLERIQLSRADLAKSESGFGSESDISTTEGAITALPIGFIYLMLAPFPWQITNLRQAITLPEILLWWASIPLMISGLWFTVKHRLRAALSVLIFTLMLTLAYSLFQGNVGTAYRQRTQIQVFLFIFIGAGWTLREEKKENRKILQSVKRKTPLTHLAR